MALAIGCMHQDWLANLNEKDECKRLLSLILLCFSSSLCAKIYEKMI